MIDETTAYGQRVSRRLREERIAWLTTVRADGTPQPSPVWFFWDGETALIYSKPDQPKTCNIEGNPRVSLHFDGDGQGGDIVVFSGAARIDRAAPPADQHGAYLEKYRVGLERIGMTAEEFARDYAVAIRVTLGKPRGH